MHNSKCERIRIYNLADLGKNVIRGIVSDLAVFALFSILISFIFTLFFLFVCFITE